MNKRANLSTVRMAADAKDTGTTEAPRSETVSMRLPQSTYILLRSVALSRAAAGARFSLSRVVVDLAEKHRFELEAETKR